MLVKLAPHGEPEREPGSPAWWSTRPAEPTQPRRGRPRRPFELIVAGAAELLDEVGTSAFTMRLLAERLGTSTATLYRHVASKDELLAYLVDRVFADITAEREPATDPPPTWQEAALDASLHFHSVLAAHPNLLPLLVTQVPVGPNALAARERIIAAYVHYGFSARLAARAYTTLARYVIGFAVQAYAPGAPGPEDAAALSDYYRSLDDDVYPLTVTAADALTGVSPEEEFLEGLQYTIDGIDGARQRDEERP